MAGVIESRAADASGPVVVIAGIPITATTRRAALQRLAASIQERRHTYYCFCEANLFSEASRDPRLVSVLAQADCVFPDGIALMVLAWTLGKRLPERISGPGFLLAACEFGRERGWRHFFYGGAPGVGEQLAARLASRFPGLKVVGTFSPPFRELTEAEEVDVQGRIEEARPDLLWVGLGGPKQEFWMARHVRKINVPVMLGVGAAFDFHSGKRPWAPAWVRKAGLEWLYRTVTGGRRTFVRNLGCVPRVGAYILRAGFARLTRPPS